MKLQNRSRDHGRLLLLHLILVAFLLTMSLPGSVCAVSLWDMEINAFSEGELLTLKFDEDIELTLRGSATQVLSLSSYDPFFYDATTRSSNLVRSMDFTGMTLTIHCTEPVSAELRRAGAGNYLLFLRPTGQPALLPISQESVAQEEMSTTPDPDMSGMPDPGSTLELARLLALQNRIDEAKNVAKAIPKDSPDFPWGQLLIGQLEERKGNASAAERHYETALEYQETAVSAATNLALHYNNQGKTDRAETMWNRVLSEAQMQIEPYDNGLTDVESETGTDSNLQFNPKESLVSFEATPLTIISVIVFLAVAAGSAFLFWRSRREKKSPAKKQDEEEDVFWSDDDEVVGAGKGALDDELDGDDDVPKPEPVSREKAVSEETRKRLVELHTQGNSIREIAEITGMSRDVIRMALQMEGVPAEV